MSGRELPPKTNVNQATGILGFLLLLISVSRRLNLLATVPGCLLVSATQLPGADESDLSNKLLGVTDEFRDQLATAARQGVIEIAPVEELCGNTSQIVGQPMRPKHQIVTDKIRALGMHFGGDELLRQTVAELLKGVRGFGGRA